MNISFICYLIKALDILWKYDSWHPRLGSPQYAAAGCRTRTHYQDPWPAINILVDSLWYIQSLITLLFIKVTELFGIQSKKCFAIIYTFFYWLIECLLYYYKKLPPCVCVSPPELWPDSHCIVHDGLLGGGHLALARGHQEHQEYQQQGAGEGGHGCLLSSVLNTVY